MSQRSRLDEAMREITELYPHLDLGWAWQEHEDRWMLFYNGVTHLFTNKQLAAWIEGFRYGRTA